MTSKSDTVPAEVKDPIIKEARKNLLGKRVRFGKVEGNILRVANVFGHEDGDYMVAELDNGFIACVDLFREVIDGKLERII